MLGSHLTDGDINAIADELVANSDQTSADAIKEAVKEASHGKALQVDVARVSARLAAGGWPLADPGK